jgi:acyl-coenzyme A synthetase/AMP-(fatty) acid ligase
VTRTAINVGRPAAASLTVSPGRKFGRCARAHPATIAATARAADARAGPNRLLCILYTSGTTGRPKGVILPHRYGTYRMATIIQEYPTTPEDRTLLKTSTALTSRCGSCSGPY